MTEIGNLEELQWNWLLDRIADGKCTPFLGAGVNAGLLPLGSTVSRTWAKKWGYPLQNCDALDQVAEFIVIQSNDRVAPKEQFVKLVRAELARIEKTELDAFLGAPGRPMGVLASLPLPVYITTNYDDLLVRALKMQGKDAKRELCRWDKAIKKSPSVFDPPKDSGKVFEPDKDHPVVFHIHGHEEVPESLVLTEDDYLDFLVSISHGRVLPPRIEEALTDTTLLFIGYRLADINFRVIFRGLVGSVEDSVRRASVSVQLPPEVQGQDAERVQSYLGKYLINQKVHVFWGTAEEFAKQLGDRWKQYAGGP
jgi:hypothetical protein